MQSYRPLTAAQLGIWLGHQRASIKTLYHCAEQVTLDGPLSRSRFETALEKTVLAAQTLHEAYVEVDGQPRAVRLQQPALRYQFVDLSQQPEAEAHLPSLIQDWLLRPLWIERGELYEHRLFRLTPERHVWVHLAHHIALDGFAFQLIARSVAALYSKPGATARFASFQPVLAADAAYEQSQARQWDAHFWQRGPAAPARALRFLPYERSPVQPLDAALPVRTTRRIAGEEFTSLVNLARSRGWPLPPLLLALVAGFGHLVTGRHRFALGVPLMLRLGTPALSVPCMAMNIARLPVEVDSGTTLSQLVDRITQRLNTQAPHQRFRYEQLGSQGFGPVVNILPFEAPRRFGDLQASSCNLAAGPVLDLSVAFTVDRQSLGLTLDGHPELYTPDGLTALHEQLWSFASRWLAAPEAPLSQQRGFARGSAPSSPTHTERSSVLATTRRRAEPAGAVERFRRATEQYPEATALIDGERRYTYRQLARAVQRGARWLLESGAQPGSLVAIELSRSATAVCAILATFEAGCGYLALDPQAPPARQARIASQASPAVLVAHSGVSSIPLEAAIPRLDAAVLESYLHQTCTPDAAQTEPKSAPAATHGVPPVHQVWPQINGPARVDPEDTAYVVFTSGSTGEPKGVVISHRALAHYLEGVSSRYGFAPGDRVLQFAPLTFDASVEELCAPLCSGASLVLRDDAMLESMAAFCQSCERWQLTVLALPTAFWHELAWATQHADVVIPKRVHTVIIGGEAADPSRVLQWCRAAPHTRLLNTYGPSEATIVVTVAELRAAAIEEAIAGGVPIGTPLDGVQALVVDERDEEVAAPQCEGELCLAGPCLADGYLGREDLTAERFVVLPKLGVRAYRTGDRVRRDVSGCLYYLGRVDDELKLSGHRIAPAEIEAALNRHPEVRASVVCAQREGTQLSLIAHLECDESLNAQELRSFLAAYLPPTMVPGVYRRHTELPRNTNGKLDRKRLTGGAHAGRALPGSSQGTEIDAVAEPGVSELERLVLETWRRVLGIPTIGLDDDFFSLGGHSLQLIQVANRLSQRCPGLSVATLFRHPTPRRLAQVIGQASSAVSRDFRHVETLDARAFQGTPVGHPPTHILMTGASGFVGIHLVNWLCHHSELPLTCLVRAVSSEAGEAKLRSLARRYKLAIPGLGQRVRVLAHDLTRPLSGEAASVLAPGGALIHCAAEVSVTRDFESLYLPNVRATRQLLELAARHGAHFHHVSTLAVTPQSEQPVRERFFSAHDGLHDGYQQSKWQAERLCEQAGALGLPVTVYRLGRISGSSVNPSINARDLVWRIARASVRVQTWPALDLAEPWLPVDWTAQLIGRAVLGNTAASDAPCRSPARVLHLAHLQPVHLDRLHAALNSVGYRLERAPLGSWLRRVRETADDEDRATLAFFELLQDARAPRPVATHYDCSQLVSLLGQQQPAVLSDALLRSYCENAIGSGALARPPGGARAVEPDQQRQ